MDLTEAITKLDMLYEDSCDTEREHIEADRILMEFLEDLGYTSLVDAYDRVNKWYS